MKTIIVLICFVFIGCLWSQANQQDGFNIIFRNDTEALYCYSFYWLDHDFKNYKNPAAMCGGELDPGEENFVEQGYSAGEWAISWYLCREQGWTSTRYLVIDEDVNLLVTTPNTDLLK